MAFDPEPTRVIEALPDSAVLLALLDSLESSGLGCSAILTDASKTFARVYANEALGRIYGVSPAELLALPPLAGLPPEEVERFTAMRWAVRGGEAAPSMTSTRVLRPDGTSAPVELGLGYTMLGELRLTFVFMRDMTEHVAMQAALRESEDRFRSVAEASPDAIFVTAGERYVYANPRGRGLIGIGPDVDIRTVDPWVKVPAARRDDLRAAAAQATRGEAPPANLVRLPQPDGQEKFLEVTVSQVSLGGAPAHISCARDVTDRVRLQGELTRRDRLATVGVLAAGVAHELNNPLTSLRLQSRRARDQADREGASPGLIESLTQIDEASARMAEIVSDLLFMSRPAVGPQAHVDVERILRSTVQLLHAGMEQPAQVAISVEATALPPITAFPSKLGQAFFNLLKNAVDATAGRSDARVEVAARVRGEVVEIVVKDNGVGMPTAIQERIAEPFFTTKPQGTGLGLWITQGIIAEHRGTLVVRSAEGEGTTVIVSLPL